MTKDPNEGSKIFLNFISFRINHKNYSSTNSVYQGAIKNIPIGVSLTVESVSNASLPWISSYILNSALISKFDI